MIIPRSLLVRHVLESNRIETIRVRSGALFQSHLHAARAVARNPRWNAPRNPLTLHRILSAGTPLEPFGGTYRTCSVWVGNRTMPAWGLVPRLMQEWEETVHAYVESTLSKQDTVYFASRLHDLFLCIHPFQDGNGRTARLVFNDLRLRKGLPWEVIENKNKRAYYHQIRITEDRLFQRFVAEAL